MFFWLVGNITAKMYSPYSSLGVDLSVLDKNYLRIRRSLIPVPTIALIAISNGRALHYHRCIDTSVHEYKLKINLKIDFDLPYFISIIPKQANKRTVHSHSYTV